jgi:AAA15 family ATPase/GTPase
MHYADFDIFDISGQTVEVATDPKAKELLTNFVFITMSELSRKIPSIKKPELNEINDMQKDIDMAQFGIGQFPNIKSIRKRIDDGSLTTHEFLGYESAGTTQFFNVIGLLMTALYSENKILIIDEFDSHLHPDLQAFLVRLFHNPQINKQNSQLIFTSHNTRLLAIDLFRRDQILITEKNPKTKSTEVNSLFDYEKRQDRSIERNYFFGRYGGIPDITYGEI